MNRLPIHPSKGITFIELMIALAATFVFLAGANSWYDNHTIRVRLSEALVVADAAKLAIIFTCTENTSLTELSNDKIGHSFPRSGYVKSVSLSGSCTQPSIMLATENTGLLVNPTLTINGELETGGGQMTWRCASDGLEVHVPKKCQG